MSICALRCPTLVFGVVALMAAVDLVGDNWFAASPAALRSRCLGTFRADRLLRVADCGARSGGALNDGLAA